MEIDNRTNILRLNTRTFDSKTEFLDGFSQYTLIADKEVYIISRQDFYVDTNNKKMINKDSTDVDCGSFFVLYDSLGTIRVVDNLNDVSANFSLNKVRNFIQVKDH